MGLQDCCPHTRLHGLHKGELDRPKFEASLDELGREGYELTWVFMDQKLHSEKDGHVLIFKRVAVRESSVAPAVTD